MPDGLRLRVLPGFSEGLRARSSEVAGGTNGWNRGRAVPGTDGRAVTGLRPGNSMVAGGSGDATGWLEGPATRRAATDGQKSYPTAMVKLRP